MPAQWTDLVDPTREELVKALPAHLDDDAITALLEPVGDGRATRPMLEGHGHCVHGVLVEGTAASTDAEESAKNALLCAAALRSSFKLALERLDDAGVDVGAMGLAVGCDYGTLAITRLGMKGEMVRCVVGRAVLRSEEEQRRCDGEQTAMGEALAKVAPAAFRGHFGASRRRSGFDYDTAVTVLVLNSKGVLAKVAQAVSEAEADISHIDMGHDPGQSTTELKLLLAVRDRVHLADVLRTLKRSPTVLKVARVKPQ